jgi:LysM repeat protein
MSMTSAAEAKLDARVRPQIVALQSRIGGPQRRPAATAPVTTAPTPARAGRTPVRLTRRGRIVAGTLVAIGVVAAASVIWLLITGQAQASGHAGPAAPLRDSIQKVVVRPGQTLWAIATEADPAADPRSIIPEIVEINSLSGTGIQVGQVLWVPKD